MDNGDHDARFQPLEQRMRGAGMDEIIINTIRQQFRWLLAGATGTIRERDITPVASVPDVQSFAPDLAEAGRAAVGATVTIKLNGGLGTSMGLDRAKSLIPVKQDLSFLDIIAGKALQDGVPLLLMNSFATRADSLAVLDGYPALRCAGLAPDFLQHMVPKLRRDNLEPVYWPSSPDLEWNPPGHGDIYPALVTSGMLPALLAAGYRYAFVSNADNLGAVIDLSILGYFVREGLPFLMEVAWRTTADRKGGHLARDRDGTLLLRETAQCPPEEMDAFQDISRYRYFNTNNLWLDLKALDAILGERNHVLGLPLIRNEKTVDPRDPGSTPVYQLETAMGSAISVLPGAGVVRVPRSRFAPVKTTDDLLVVRSDIYGLTPDMVLAPCTERAGALPMVSLDPRYYRLLDQFEARFPCGAPSLMECTSLTVEGDVRFESGVVIRGRVHLANHGRRQVTVAAGSLIDQDRSWD